ncbi:MAG TPA: AraC family transcriptional regulator ligand-binding domain-containing protein [Fluviicoccus sp.]|nr:AraC family transcriptional regulator ligand-binding domain-containing protein [Fluviicoccus sp.]
MTITAPPPDAAIAPGVVSAFVIRHVMQLGHKLGVGREPLMARAVVSEADLAPADGWVRQDVLERLLLCSLDYWRDPVVTLRVVLAMDPAMMGVLGYLMQCCPTLIDMQQALTEFSRLVSTVHAPSITHEPGVSLWAVEVRSSSEVFARHSEEGYLALCAQLIHRQAPEALLGVRLRHAPAIEAGLPHPLYTRAFPCPVRFGQRQSALVVDPQALNRPLPFGDAAIFETLRQQARMLVQQLGAQPRLADRVKECLRGLLARGLSSREAVAAELGLSPRHLHRRLQEEGGRYQAILDELRSELAHKQLLQSRDGLDDIAARLGFSSAGSFSRWFRQTTGLTPQEFRRATLSG